MADQKEVQQIIEYNIKRIISITKNNTYKYKHLVRLLSEDGNTLKKLYIGILKDYYNKDFFKVEGYYTFFISIDYIVKYIRRKGQSRTADHYINYLVSMGLLGKWTEHEKSFIEVHNKYYNGTKKPNFFYILKLNESNLTIIEDKCKYLIDKGITKGNIKRDALILGFNAKELADNVYSDTSRINIYKRKAKDVEAIKTAIDSLIDEQGYTTKEQVRERLKMDVIRFDTLLKDSRLLKREYIYKQPKNIERTKYNYWGKSFIILQTK